jgi:hypothetical protein
MRISPPSLVVGEGHIPRRAFPSNRSPATHQFGRVKRSRLTAAAVCPVHHRSPLGKGEPVPVYATHAATDAHAAEGEMERRRQNMNPWRPAGEAKIGGSQSPPADWRCAARSPSSRPSAPATELGHKRSPAHSPRPKMYFREPCRGDFIKSADRTVLRSSMRRR